MTNWWQLIACSIIVFLAAGIFYTNTPELPRIYIYQAVSHLSREHTLWQTRSWMEEESENFRIRHRVEDESVARIVLDTAEEIYTPVNTMIQSQPPDKPLIIIYPDRDSLARQFGWTASESAMGVYWNGVIRILSPFDWAGTEDPGEIGNIFRETGPMAHEYTHLLVDFKARGNYPRWLTEGVAQYVEREVTGFTMPVPSGTANWFSLEEIDRRFDSPPAQSLVYYQSLMMVDFFIKKYGMETLQQMLNILGEGVTLKESFRRVTGTCLEEYETEFAKNVPLKVFGSTN